MRLWVIGGIIVTGIDRRTLRKASPSATRSTLTDLGSNSVLQSETSTSESLNTCTADVLTIATRWCEVLHSKTLTILSTHRPCFYLCTISRPERSLQYRRCCTIRQSVRSEPALRLWCAALLVTRPVSYQWRPCAPVRRPLSAASLISETWHKRIREFWGIVRLEGSRTLIVAYSECFLLPVLRLKWL